MDQGEEVQPHSQREKIFVVKSKVKVRFKERVQSKVKDDAFPRSETHHTTTYPNISILAP